jgi:hypothetical protein
MATYPFAYGLTLDNGAEAKVRLSGPNRKALTHGVVLFATVLSKVYSLSRDRLKPPAGEPVS